MIEEFRDEDGQWVTFEAYLQKHTGTNFSHAICEECNDSLFSNFNHKNHVLTKPKLNAIDKRD